MIVSRGGSPGIRMRFLGGLLACAFRLDFPQAFAVDCKLRPRIFCHLLRDFDPVHSHAHRIRPSRSRLSVFLKRRRSHFSLRITQQRNRGPGRPWLASSLGGVFSTFLEQVLNLHLRLGGRWRRGASVPHKRSTVCLQRVQRGLPQGIRECHTFVVSTRLIKLVLCRHCKTT
jgi:hypothetical protein